MPARRFTRLAALAAFALLAPAARAETASPSPAVVAALAAPQALPDVVEGRPRAGDDHRICFPDLQPLRRFPQGGLAGNEGQICRRRQGEVHPAGVPARFLVDRRLHACALRRGEARRRDRPSVRSPVRVGVHRQPPLPPQRAAGRDRHAGGRVRRLPQESGAVRQGQGGARGRRGEAQGQLDPDFFVDGVEISGEHALDKIDEILSARAG